MEKRKRFIYLYVKLGIIFTLILLFVVFKILANNRYFCENYTNSVLKVYSIIFGSISSFFPFSLFEIFLILNIAYVIIWIVFFVIGSNKYGIKKTYNMILRLVIVALSIVTIYQMTAGISYGREFPDIPQHNELIDDPQDYRKICMKFIDDFNDCASKLEYDENGSVVKPYSDDILVMKIQHEFNSLDSEYFYKFDSKVKPMYLTSWAYRMCSISGFSFIPFGEANYNFLNNDSYLPFTIAHEMAHARGAMPEEYANITAAYICLNSDDPYIRFSGHNVALWSLDSFIRATNNDNYISEFYQKIDSRIYKNNEYQNNYWEEHAQLQKFGNWINDLYLKSNNEKGTVSYTDNIDVVVTPTEYKISSYSRYQALYLWFYYDK